MGRYCRGAACRHKALVQYFGQPFEADNCKACDLCLGDTTEIPNATVVAQKILSCVARVKESFGIGHVVSILRGEDTENVAKRGHDKLTTFGLLKGVAKADVREWIYQLLGQDVLLQVGDEYPLLKLNEASWEVMRGQRTVRLLQLVRRKKGRRRRSRVRKRYPGKAWTPACSRNCGCCAPGWRHNSRCPRIASSATRCCATWPGCGPRRPRRCG